jgi:ectoine hydroxylase-related dioxygenase (phytanoyl-CoA dioxygenase family)
MNELITGDGYVVIENVIPHELLDSLVSKQDTLYPVRASSNNKKYAERDEIKNLPNISVWWSQMVMDWPEVIEIEKLISVEVLKYLSDPVWYASDIVVLEPNSKWISPHIDTPHRFKAYNYNKNLLGVQIIAPFNNLDETTGSTGVLPGSQKQDFNINLCYRGVYNDIFMKKYVQPKMPKGSILLYNCRLLHSSMPNPQPIARPALLLNYLTKNIIEDVKKLDNFWDSNG